MKLTILTVAILMACCPAAIFADDYYVDAQSGDDATGDGSSQRPWKTITFAFSQITGVDHVLNVRPGTYDTAHGESFPLTLPSGLTLHSTDGPDATRLVGDGSSAVVAVHNTVQLSETRVEGFTITGGLDGIGLHDSSGNYIVFLVNNTITANSRAGVYTGTRVGGENGRLFGNSISDNFIGFYNRNSTGSPTWSFADNRIFKNRDDGVRLRSIYSGGRTISERDWIGENGGIGWNQFVDVTAFLGRGWFQTTLTNTTISGNAAGGAYTFANYYCYYLPYFGYQCVDPLSTISASNCTISRNGGFGGVMRAGTSFGARGHLGGTIAWGNSALDNVNFTAAVSDIGTGNTSGNGVFSADPLFVDASAGDYRLRSGSPCIDALPTPGTSTVDIESEPRSFDGDGNGVAQDDIGSDEFHMLVFPGTAPLPGQPFWFEVQAPPAEDGNLATVLLSLDEASDAGGILIPGSGGRRVQLEADSLFGFGLAVLPFLQTTLQSQVGMTPACNLPSGASGLRIHYAAVTLDVTLGQFVSITPTHSFKVP